ncbi:MAG: hypothetical protein M3O70_00220 [Actinomycetota bacterium]|nr:hypothetical protein [Actinomycetota bacterium]
MVEMPYAQDQDIVTAVRAHRERVVEIARRFGLSNLRIAPTGRALVDLDEGGNYDTLAAFDRAVAEELGLRIDAHPAEVLGRPGHGRDFDDAVPV